MVQWVEHCAARFQVMSSMPLSVVCQRVIPRLYVPAMTSNEAWQLKSTLIQSYKLIASQRGSMDQSISSTMKTSTICLSNIARVWCWWRHHIIRIVHVSKEALLIIHYYYYEIWTTKRNHFAKLHLRHARSMTYGLYPNNIRPLNDPPPLKHTVR